MIEFINNNAISSSIEQLMFFLNDMFCHCCSDMSNDFSSSLIRSFNAFDLQQT